MNRFLSISSCQTDDPSKLVHPAEHVLREEGCPVLTRYPTIARNRVKDNGQGMNKYGLWIYSQKERGSKPIHAEGLDGMCRAWFVSEIDIGASAYHILPPIARHLNAILKVRNWCSGVCAHMDRRRARKAGIHWINQFHMCHRTPRKQWNECDHPKREIYSSLLCEMV